ncbi:uncharacterized protein EDB93DRAFT_19685 [Suillus bovinus]|uniref:uncharacterized protein n=1 Tax=Suillus bovinus TaxID=48563 RepID=UPI001B86338C|nr:uncharacterized protein EDB93DRAFT_19685 [Suillus bovinus]KAG2159834.1 hypothetical protein EDB93DRAFT_19685 [Suillus bovinus]
MHCSTTLESTLFITTTNAEGQPTTTAPSIVTEVTISTNSAGAATTVTVAVANPTLAPNYGTTSGSADTGAVVGVFLVVGLAAASIVLWIFFFIRRRSRINRIDHETEVEAAVAASGFGRAPLDDDNDYRGARSPQSYSLSSAQMVQRGSPVGYIPDGSGLPTSTSGQPVSGGPFDDDNVAFNPYAGYIVEGPPTSEGYIQARSASPPPGTERQGPPSSLGLHEISDSSRDRKSSYGHTPTYSVASYEPLLAAYTQGSSAERGVSSPPTPPPRNPARRAHLDSVASRPVNNLSDGGADDRLDPEIRRRTRSDSLGSDDLKDEEDYSRPMLTVRNMPDGRSINSAL